MVALSDRLQWLLESILITVLTVCPQLGFTKTESKNEGLGMELNGTWTSVFCASWKAESHFASVIYEKWTMMVMDGNW
jgi:hypothetical protein